MKAERRRRLRDYIEIYLHLWPLLRAERVAGARAVRQRLLEPNTGGEGLFASLQPWSVALRVCRPMDLLNDDGSPEEMEALEELRERLLQYFAKSRAGRVLPIPTFRELQKEFGRDFAPIVDAMWPVVAVFAELAKLDSATDVDPDKRRETESRLHWDGRAICLLRNPPRLSRAYHVDLVTRLAQTAARPQQGILVSDLIGDVHAWLADKRDALLTFDPRSGRPFYASWSVTVRRRAVDLADRLARAGQFEAHPSDAPAPARSTMSKYRKKEVDDVAAKYKEGLALQRHRDPEKQVMTIGELEELDGVGEGTYRKVLKRLEVDNGPAPRRGVSFALDADWQAKVRAAAGETRGGKGARPRSSATKPTTPATTKDAEKRRLTLDEAARALGVDAKALRRRIALFVDRAGYDVELNQKLPIAHWAALAEDL